MRQTKRKTKVVKKVTKKKVTTKKPAAKKAQPKPKVWTRERVNALYDLSSNVPANGPHLGQPHEWEWEEDDYPPSCLACNERAEDVESNKPPKSSVSRNDDDWCFWGDDV